MDVAIEDTYNYVGCTRTTVHAHMVENLKVQRQLDKSGALYRYDYEVHSGVKQQYSTEILGRERKILRLYTLEAKHMEQQKQGLSMNDRQERSRRGRIVRLSAYIDS